MKQSVRKARRGAAFSAGAVILAAVFLFLTGAAAANGTGAIPDRAEARWGETVYKNARAEIDATNLAEGYISVRCSASEGKRLKVQITREAGVTYTYNLNGGGAAEIFPLTEGDGNYTVKVYESTAGNRYALVFSQPLTLTLRNPFLPFLYPNQYVHYTAESAVAAKAAELSAGAANSFEELSAIYNYVVDRFTYDYERAKTVSSGYLPDVDAVLAEEKGICFDYAAVMTAMLRSRDIPCKLVIGYSDTVYHAWIDVYIENVGWIDKVIYFDGTSWQLLDPTFVSTGKRTESTLQYVSDKTHYTRKYAY